MSEQAAQTGATPTAPAAKLLAWGTSDVGKTREHNEDSFLVDLPLGLFVVADGMGGHAAGEVASATTVEAIHKAIAAQRAPFERLATDASPAARADAMRAVEAAILAGCREVFRMGQADRRRKGMGCTVDVVAVAGTTAIIGHVGDSRVYLLREGKAHILTEDHTLAAQLVRLGKMTWKELEGSDFRSILQRAVGVQESVEVDTLVVELAEGDRLLLCSDGLHGYFEDDPAPATRFDGEVATLSSRLVAFANERGGDDNITAVIVAVGGATDDRQAALRHEVMGKTPLFENLTTKEQAAILAVGQVQEVAAGTIIVQENAPGDDLYVVIRGRAAVLKDGVAIAELGPGGHFGEMGLVDHTRSASVRAEENSAILHIERPDLMAVMRREPTIGVKLLWGLVQTLSERLRATNADIVVLHGKLSGTRREGPF